MAMQWGRGGFANQGFGRRNFGGGQPVVAVPQGVQLVDAAGRPINADGSLVRPPDTYGFYFGRDGLLIYGTGPDGEQMTEETNLAMMDDVRDHVDTDVDLEFTRYGPDPAVRVHPKGTSKLTHQSYDGATIYFNLASLAAGYFRLEKRKLRGKKGVRWAQVAAEGEAATEGEAGAGASGNGGKPKKRNFGG